MWRLYSLCCSIGSNWYMEDNITIYFNFYIDNTGYLKSNWCFWLPNSKFPLSKWQDTNLQPIVYIFNNWSVNVERVIFLCRARLLWNKILNQLYYHPLSISSLQKFCSLHHNLIYRYEVSQMRDGIINKTQRLIGLTIYRN